MRVVHFGTYSTGEGYPRNAVIARGLRSAGVEVIELRENLWGGSGAKARGVTSASVMLMAALRLVFAWIKLKLRYLFSTPAHDVIIVGYSGHLDVFLAKALSFFTRKPVVLDAFLSLFEAIVEDRKLATPGSLKGRLALAIDRASSRAADLVLLDTDEHIDYYRNDLAIRDAEFVRVFVGGEEDIFVRQPYVKSTGVVEVLFFGTFLPLHGTDVIAGAMRRLSNEKNIRFTIVGDGPEWEKSRAIAGDLPEGFVRWERRWVDYSELRSMIAASHICLGVFGSGPKAGRVIPCKAFNVLAVGRPLITSDTPAAREAFVDGENAILTPPGDAAALADAIMKLARDADTAARLAEAGHATYSKLFSLEAVGAGLRDELERRFGPFGK